MRMSRLAVALVLAGACAPVAGEGDDLSPEPPDLVSPAFADGEDIPVLYTCDGDDVVIPVSWDAMHPDAVEVVLVLDDPDAPRGTFVHWIVAGLPVAGTIAGNGLPDGAVEGVNDFGNAGYGGPCPPPGDAPHGYRLTMTGVSGPTGLSAGFGFDDLLEATDATGLSSGVLIGHYGR